MKYIVEKRDGNLVDFQIGKIVNVIKKAFGSLHKEWDESVIELLALRVTADFDAKKDGNRIGVEQIQDSVEKVLSESGFTEVSKAYILYRKQRENVRKLTEHLDRHTSLIASYLSSAATGAGFSNQGMNQYVARQMLRHFWLEEMFDQEIRDAIREGKMIVEPLDSMLAQTVTLDLSQFEKPKQHYDMVVVALHQIVENLAEHVVVSQFETILTPDQITRIRQRFDETRVRFQNVAPARGCFGKVDVVDLQPETLGLAQRALDVRRQVMERLDEAGFYPCEGFMKTLEGEICVVGDSIRTFEKTSGYIWTRKRTISGDEALFELEQEALAGVGTLFDRVEYRLRFVEPVDSGAARNLCQSLRETYPFIADIQIVSDF